MSCTVMTTTTTEAGEMETTQATVGSWQQRDHDYDIRVQARQRMMQIFASQKGNRDEQRERKVAAALEHLCYETAQSRDEFVNTSSFEVLLHRIASEKAKRRRADPKKKIASASAKQDKEEQPDSSDLGQKTRVSDSSSDKTTAKKRKKKGTDGETFNDLLSYFFSMDPNHAKNASQRREAHGLKARGKAASFHGVGYTLGSINSNSMDDITESDDCVIPSPHRQLNETLKQHPDVHGSNTNRMIKEEMGAIHAPSIFDYSQQHQHQLAMYQRACGVRGAPDLWRMYEQKNQSYVDHQQYQAQEPAQEYAAHDFSSFYSSHQQCERNVPPVLVSPETAHDGHERITTWPHEHSLKRKSRSDEAAYSLSPRSCMQHE